MPALRRTLSAPAVRANAGPYSPSGSPRRTNTFRRRVLGEIDWWNVVDGQGQLQPIPQADENAVPQAQAADVTTETAMQPVWNNVDAAGTTPIHAVVNPLIATENITVRLAALALAPQTPSRRRRNLRREASLSPSGSDTMSIPGSPNFALPPLPSPIFDAPETPRRIRTRRAPGLDRTATEPLIFPATPSRRRRLARTSSSLLIGDENAPMAAPSLFN